MTDPTLALMTRAADGQRMRVGLGLGAVVVGVVLYGLIAFSGPEYGIASWSIWMVSFAGMGLYLAAGWGSANNLVQAMPLLGLPGERVGARVVRAGSWWRPTVIAFDEGWTAEVRLRPGCEEVLRRRGQVSLLRQPHIAFLHVDGSRRPFRVRPVQAEAGEAVPASDAYPFTPSRQAARGLWVRQCLAPLGASAAVGLAAGNAVRADHFAWFGVVGFLVILLFPLVMAVLPSSRALVRRGEWTWVPVVLDPFGVTHPERVKVRGRATLPDGAQVRIKSWADPDLPAAAWAAGGLWVAGTPGPGRTLAVGFPEVPLAAAVRFGDRVAECAP